MAEQRPKPSLRLVYLATAAWPFSGDFSRERGVGQAIVAYNEHWEGIIPISGEK